MAAFLTPPCPKRAGVLRPSHAADVARCQCGFEVDGIHLYATRKFSESERAAQLLARGRMVPIPQHEPGVRVGRDAAALRDVGWDHRWEQWPAWHSLPGFPKAVCGAARTRGAELGLLYAGEAAGAMLALPDGRTLTERRSMYGLAPAGFERDCARSMVDAIVAEHGPGRWWTLAGAVHIIVDDERSPVCDIGGVPHVGMRSLYFHDPDPARRVIGCAVVGDDDPLAAAACEAFRAEPRADGFRQEQIDEIKARMLAPGPRKR